jgi:uncharacterized protein YeaO (DUF488 family)
MLRGMNELRVKRVYEPPEKADGLRVLVDRLWPRGINKEKAAIDLWLKEIAPSDDLRKRFHARPALWEEFRKAYGEELRRSGEGADTILDHLKNRPVTLLYAARDEEHNNAVALRAWLLRRRR